MTTTTTSISPLLKRFQDYLPGDIHAVAAKIHLMAGFEACTANTLAAAAWNDDKSALVVTFTNGTQTTLLLEGFRLLVKCTCNQWQPARNCPHVVVVWATLKRMVSPETLTHIRFNKQLLLDMKLYTDRDPASANDAATDAATKQGELARSLAEARRLRNEHIKSMATPPAEPKPSPQFRLVIESSRYSTSLSGRLMRGNETVHGWTSAGIPTDLARFMASNYYYESSPRYFETFLKLTGGKYPIVYRHEQERETTLVYRSEEPCRASIAFDIRGDEVIISRTLDNGRPIPPGAIHHGHLLFDPESGTILPITDRNIWRDWENLIEELDSVNDRDEFDEYEEDESYADEFPEDDDSEPVISPQGLRRLPHAVAAPIALFNKAAIRLNPEMLANDENCNFHINGATADRPQPGTPTYLLDIPHGIEQAMIALEPAGLYNGQTFPCSNAVFWLLNPAGRGHLSTAMKTKKRVRAVLETALILKDETKTTKRNTIIRALTSSPDFLKRDVKKEAKQLLHQLAEEWNRKMLLLQATPDGWHCVEDDRHRQADLMRILFELFGLEAFTGNVYVPGWIGIPRERLLKDLPELVSRLQAEDFALRIGNEPLASANWEFSLDATKSSLDWFELHPKIRCDGELLTEEELRTIMEGNGFVRRNGRLIMLDELDARVLAMCAGAMPPRKRKQGAKAEAVRVPRLQILDWLQLRSHGVTVLLSPEDSLILESLLNFETVPERTLPAGLNATLRHYQADAWRWLAFLYEHRFGACLADDMGLGKTVQSITLLAGLMSGEITSYAAPGTPHLIVVPPSLLFNWEAEIARFLPDARVLLYVGTGRTSAAFADHDIIITSYGIVQRDIAELEQLDFNVIIYDEAQVVKNLQAATTNAVRKLKGSFVLALTGTPVENHIGEYYAIMDLCLPGLLGSREEFARRTGKGDTADIARLIGRTRPFILRRSKQLIAAELPPKIETDIQLELSSRQKAFYQRTVEEVRGQVKQAYESQAPAQARIIALTAILRLRQICLAPVLAKAGAEAASPKLEFLIEQLEELRDEGHSALVFSQFTGYLDIIEQGLKRHGLPCLRLDGTTPVPHRKKLVQAFQNAAEPAVFLISLKAGGKGLNLTRATYVYHMDPWWNPAVENQASDRAHRIGQTEQVTITRLIMRHTIEEKMMALKERKTQLYKAILEEGATAGGAGLTREDFEFLLG